MPTNVVIQPDTGTVSVSHVAFVNLTAAEIEVCWSMAKERDENHGLHVRPFGTVDDAKQTFYSEHVRQISWRPAVTLGALGATFGRVAMAEVLAERRDALAAKLELPVPGDRTVDITDGFTAGNAG